LYNGERRAKTDKVFEVLGHQDELNAVLGIAREFCDESNTYLINMYNNSIMATSTSKFIFKEHLFFYAFFNIESQRSNRGCSI